MPRYTWSLSARELACSQPDLLDSSPRHNSPVGLTVRRGTESDADTAFGIWEASISRRRGRPPTAAGSLRVRNRLTGKSDGLLLIAEEDGRAVGMAWGIEARADDGAGDAVPGVFHLSLMFIDPARWGEGIGRHLTQALFETLPKSGMRAIELWTHEDNVRAQRLYTRCGFKATDRVHQDDEGQSMRLWTYAIANSDKAASG